MNSSLPIHIDELRVGMFIQLPLSWMQHPFPTSNFRIASSDQIRVLRELGVKSLHYVPARSILAAAQPGADALQEQPPASPGHPAGAMPQDQEQQAGAGTAPSGPAPYGPAQPDCQARYRQTSAAYEEIAAQVAHEPLLAHARAQALVDECASELEQADACVIRLMADGDSPGAAAHAANVLVLALLLGRALELRGPALRHVGLAALLHDIGKTTMPAHIGEPGARLPPAELQRYQAHVGESVALGQRMGLPSDVLIAMAQHHERADGSGYPLRLVAEDLSRSSQVLALVNAYDRLCNPLLGAQVHTPHEAVSRLYAQQRAGFDAVVMGAFIRMMGVYPPGSLVQLVDGRHALVTSVDAGHPLRPSVLVHVAGSEVQAVDLSLHKDLGIRRSLRPSQLPRAALQALWPDSRICYYFERAVAADDKDEQP